MNELFDTPSAPTPEMIYAAYPRKQAKGTALKAIAKAISKKRVSAGDLLYAVTAYAACVADWPESERQYVPLCASWVNGDRWEDDRALWVKNARKGQRTGGAGEFSGAF